MIKNSPASIASVGLHLNMPRWAAREFARFVPFNRQIDGCRRPLAIRLSLMSIFEAPLCDQSLTRIGVEPKWMPLGV
jgi:hypothetical protein